VFDSVTLTVSDLGASERFYATVLAAIGLEPVSSGAGGVRWERFAIVPADADANVTRRLHIGFAAGSRAQVDEFWRVGVAAGYRDDGEPGPRPQYRDDYYGAFLLDPDANSAEAVHHGALRVEAVVDHLWIRVRDIAAATAFYEEIAPAAGLRIGSADAEHAWFQAAASSFTLVEGEPTRHLRMAFEAAGAGAIRIDPDANTIELVALA
jgi:catechol 2,3-dioxygenase-like lactoylglutathione lyase family enzyme